MKIFRKKFEELTNKELYEIMITAIYSDNKIGTSFEVPIFYFIFGKYFVCNNS